jgi:D-sedoheptulose 7-phosphate isomerase|tara:strand:- start:316 stop:873 length:558 start_codon:yes stop_codon:yes gene_type:complete
MKDLIKKSINQHSEFLKLIDKAKIIDSANIILDALSKGKTIFWCGNGGSASQANHLSAELVGGMYQQKNKPFRSICLNVDSAFITAWSNDDSFENIFVRQLEAMGQNEDILIGLSTSGNSPNIVKAAQFAQSNKIKVISLTGNDGGNLKECSDINMNIETSNTQRVQEIHILIGHILCDIIEQSL